MGRSQLQSSEEVDRPFEVSDRCSEPILHRQSNGRIVSHKGYQAFPYSNNMDCYWEIQNPLGGNIVVQFTSMRLENPSADLEEERMECKYDYVELFSDMSKNSKSLGRFCGSQIPMEPIISPGPTLSIFFHTDSGLVNNGFQLRYTLVPDMENCTAEEPGCRKDLEQLVCVDTSRGTTFGLHRNWICDGWSDCPDGLDESPEECQKVGSERVETSDKNMSSKVVCPVDTFTCPVCEGTEGSKELLCLPREYVCDGEADCPCEEDETGCSVPRNLRNRQRMRLRTPEIDPNDLSPSNTAELNLEYLDGDVESNETDTSNTTIRSSTIQCSTQKIAPYEDRIVGGRVARAGSWPWQTSMRFGGGHICGGSIVTPNWIVTAAHCVHGKTNPAYYRIDAGRARKNANERTLQRRKAIRVIAHSRYNPRSIDNDIAMIKVSPAFNFNDRVVPVCVGQSEMKTVGQPCFVTGWGNTKGTGGDGYLKQAKVPIVDRKQCNIWYKGRITGTMICAGYTRGGADACQGDSGGPFVCKPKGSNRYLQYGVVSWGGECAAAYSPGIYSNLPIYLEWMRKVVKSN